MILYRVDFEDDGEIDVSEPVSAPEAPTMCLWMIDDRTASVYVLADDRASATSKAMEFMDKVRRVLE